MRRVSDGLAALGRLAEALNTVWIAYERILNVVSTVANYFWGFRPMVVPKPPVATEAVGWVGGRGEEYFQAAFQSVLPPIRRVASYSVTKFLYPKLSLGFTGPVESALTGGAVEDTPIAEVIRDVWAATSTYPIVEASPVATVLKTAVGGVALRTEALAHRLRRVVAAPTGVAQAGFERVVEGISEWLGLATPVSGATAEPPVIRAAERVTGRYTGTVRRSSILPSKLSLTLGATAKLWEAVGELYEETLSKLGGDVATILPTPWLEGSQGFLEALSEVAQTLVTLPPATTPATTAVPSPTLKIATELWAPWSLGGSSKQLAETMPTLHGAVEMLSGALGGDLGLVGVAEAVDAYVGVLSGLVGATAPPVALMRPPLPAVAPGPAPPAKPPIGMEAPPGVVWPKAPPGVGGVALGEKLVEVGFKVLGSMIPSFVGVEEAVGRVIRGLASRLPAASTVQISLPLPPLGASLTSVQVPTPSVQPVSAPSLRGFVGGIAPPPAVLEAVAVEVATLEAGLPVPNFVVVYYPELKTVVEASVLESPRYSAVREELAGEELPSILPQPTVRPSPVSVEGPVHTVVGVEGGEELDELERKLARILREGIRRFYGDVP